MTDIVDRLRSRAEAPNAWTRDDFFLIEVADEIERQDAEIEHLKAELAEWTSSFNGHLYVTEEQFKTDLADARRDERKRCADAVRKALSHSSKHDVAKTLALEAIEDSHD